MRLLHVLLNLPEFARDQWRRPLARCTLARVCSQDPVGKQFRVRRFEADRRVLGSTHGQYGTRRPGGQPAPRALAPQDIRRQYKGDTADDDGHARGSTTDRAFSHQGAGHDAVGARIENVGHCHVFFGKAIQCRPEPTHRRAGWPDGTASSMATLDRAILLLVDAALARDQPSIVVVDRDAQKMTVLPVDQWVTESRRVPEEARNRIAADATARHGEAVMVLTISGGTINVFASSGSGDGNRHSAPDPDPDSAPAPASGSTPALASGSTPAPASGPASGSDPTLETESPGAGSSGSDS